MKFTSLNKHYLSIRVRKNIIANRIGFFIHSGNKMSILWPLCGTQTFILPLSDKKNSILLWTHMYRLASLGPIQSLHCLDRKMTFRGPYKGREILNVKQCNTFSILQLPYGTRKFIFCPQAAKWIFAARIEVAKY